MSRETLGLSDALSVYVRRVGVREDLDLQRLREETASHPMGFMQISPEQGQLMVLLVELIGASRVFEVGTFTGYSAMCLAKGLGRNGRIVSLDISEEFTDIARRHWSMAGIADRIDLRVGPAEVSLSGMIAAGEGESYDFAFIDADKTGYDDYYERAISLLRPGGLMAIDNVLWEGCVIEPGDQRESTVALRALNEKVMVDQRVTMCLVPIGDGMTLVRKR